MALKFFLYAYKSGDPRDPHLPGLFTIGGVDGPGDVQACLDFINARNDPRLERTTASNTAPPMQTVSVREPDRTPPAHEEKVAPSSTTAKPTPTQTAPAETSVKEGGGDEDYFRLPTVKAIVKTLYERGTKSREAILSRVEHLQGIGVTALDVISKEDLPTRVANAMSALNI